jgi:choice-of-anchor C domain-containing protein
MKATIIFIVTLCSWCSQIKTQAQLVANGSFESGLSFTNAYVQADSPDTTSLTGWNISAGTIDICATQWQPGSGTRSLDMNGWTAGTIKQELTKLIPSEDYRVTFLLAGNPNPADQTNRSLTVFFGTQSKTFNFNTSGKSTANMGWLIKSADFTATTNTLDLKFQSNEAENSGPALDAVVLRHGS